MVATKFREGAFCILSGTPTETLSALREEGLYNSSKVVGITSHKSSIKDVLVMYWTGARNVLTDLLMWFKLDKSTGLVTVYDSSSSGLTGTLVSGALISGISTRGILSGCLQISGTHFSASSLLSGGHVKIDHSSALTPHAGTICAWIKNDEIVSGGHTVYEYGRATGDYPERYYLNLFLSGSHHLGSVLYFGYRAGADAVREGSTGEYFTIMSGTTSILDNTWAHVGVTSDGGTTKLYVNGIREANVNVSGINVGQWFGDLPTSGTWASYIGASFGSGAFRNHFAGLVEDFRVANYAFSDDQMKALADNYLV